MKSRVARPLAAAGAGVLAIAAGLALFGGPLLHAAVGGAGRLAGYRVRYAGIERTHGRLRILSPSVRSLGGEPVFRAREVDVDYSLPHVLGGPYFYGITALALDRPAFTLIHHRDGTYNVTFPGSGGPSSQGFVLPRIRLSIEAGSFAIRDETRIFPRSRSLALTGIEATADLQPDARSQVALAFSIVEGGRRFPFAGRGTFDESRGYELSRLRAPALALSPLLDFVANSTAFHVTAGTLQGLDLVAYGLRDRDGVMRRHFSGAARLTGFQTYVGGLAKPLREGRGRLYFYDAGLTLPDVVGSIAGVPVRIAGGIYGLAHPALRLAIAGRGELRSLLTIASSAGGFPLRGTLGFRLLVEGDATEPLTFARFDAGRLAYDRIPLDAASGLVALRGNETTILRSTLQYDGIVAGARGRVLLGKHTGVEVLATVAADSRRLPYAGRLLGGMRVRGSVLANGVDAALATDGEFAGRAAGRRLAGTFAVDPHGVGTIGPIVLDGPGGETLYARVALQRPRAGGAVAYLSARALRLSTGGTEPALPGVALPRLPPASATLDADAAATFGGGRYAGSGSAHLYAARVLGTPVGDLRFQAGANDPGRIALAGRYRGEVGPLVRLAGGNLAGSGRADVPFAVLASGTSDVVAQIAGAHFSAARVGGIALDGLEGTVRLHGPALEVEGARLRLGGGELAARGRFGNGGALFLSGTNLDLGRLRSAGVPIANGSATALARVSGTATAPDVEAGVVARVETLPQAAVAALPVEASTSLSYAGGELDLRDGLVRALAAVGMLGGRLRGIGAAGARTQIALGVRVDEADLATLAQLSAARLPYPAGTLDADLRVAGNVKAPRLAGRISIPEGSLNGLRFRNASFAVDGDASRVRAREGKVTVGNSAIAFEADFSRSAQTLALRAPHVELTDLNDYFDQGDTLGGTGSIAVRVRNAAAVTVEGRVRLAHTRFRRFDLGDTRIDAGTSGRTVRLDASVDGAAGHVSARGALSLPPAMPLRNTFARSPLTLAARAQDVDLDRWLPAAGIQSPLSGLVEAAATARGTYPNLTLVAHADLQHGLLQRIPIRTASLDVRAARGVATIASATLAIDNLTAGGTGTVALRRDGPLDLRLRGSTANAGALAKTIAGKAYDVTGSVQANLHVTGTPRRPKMDGVLDADRVGVGNFVVPHVHGEAIVTPALATLAVAEIDLPAGRLLAHGYAPLQTSPAVAIGPPGAPLELSLAAERVGLAQFAVLLPKGTQVEGELNGTVGLGGSIANPAASGLLSLTGGSYAGPAERSKIVGAQGELALHERTLELRNARAGAGGGVLSASGSVVLPDLRNPLRDAVVDVALGASNAVLDIPGYFRGRVLGRVTLVRNPGTPALVAGNLAFTSTRIVPNVLLNRPAPAPAASATPFPVAFDLGVQVGNDVRAQGGPVDVGAKGRLQLGGTLASPTLRGKLEATDGTISFYRTFQLQYPSTLTFSPGDGIIPDVDATATSSVNDPPTDVTLHVTGAATQLNVALSSNPSYSRQQILGILVGAANLGAVSGVANNGGSGAPANPFTAAATGELGTLLTQNLLEPISSQLGSTVGLSSLGINYIPGAGGVNLSARKKLFKDVSAVFAQSFNYPPRQSIGLVASPSDATAIQLTLFSQPSSNRFDTFGGTAAQLSTNTALTAAEPTNGTNGFAISFQRKFR